MRGNRPTLTARQIRAIQALLEEPTTAAAAQAAQVSEATIFRWLADPAFSAAYREARSRLVETALTALQSASSEAVKTLRNTLTDPHAPPNIKVSAARAILEFSLKAREALDFEDRLERLENSLKARRKNA